MDIHWETIKSINQTKGRDYAGSEDALSNFKRTAEQTGLTPYQVWGVLTNKHWDAVQSFVRNNGQLESEPIEGRLHDLIVYCFLMLGLIEDQKGVVIEDNAFHF